MKKRSWSIRTRILILLLAPLLPLVGIWVFSTQTSLDSALNLLDAKLMSDDAGQPANTVVIEIQAERKMAIAYVSQTNPLAMGAQRDRTDAAIVAFRRLSSGERLQGAVTDLTRFHIGQVNEALDKLVIGRLAIDSRQSSRIEIMALYDEVIDRTFAMYSTIGGVDDQSLARQASTIISLTIARDMLHREDALISGVLAAGKVSAPELASLIQAIGLNRYLFNTATGNLTSTDQETYRALLNTIAFQNMRTMEDRLITQGSPNAALPIDGLWWTTTFNEVDEGLRVLGDTAANRALESATPMAVNILLRLALAGGLGLIVIIVLLISSIRIARSLIRRISEVRMRALELANERLPQAVARLRNGEEVEIPQLDPFTETDELGQLSFAFAAVQRTALESAVQEAALRRGLNQVFLNIGRRSQTLVHRQLSLLDTMERRVTDPHELEELYRVDHLAVRMRRYAEDLVILAGAVPGRGWRNPVPLADVLRSAMSEVEAYTRVNVVTGPEISLTGRAVSDVIHLLAELLENATTFSPKDTQVKLVGQMLPNGFAVEIEDRGVGLPAMDMAQANAQLADPPDFDPARSSRLGLFVVARLAARHGIRVTLQTSPYGGITAIALLPTEIIVNPATATEPIIGTVVEAAAEPSPRHALLQSTVSMPAITPGGPTVREVAVVGSASTAGSTNGTHNRSRDVSLSPDGLPVRARQANLVPQLRSGPSLDEPAEQTIPPRPAEASRALLSALQDGVSRGRRAAEAQAETTEETR